MLPQRLTESSISKAVPRDKAFTLSDGGGLFLLITPNGGKWWRLRYWLGGRENRLSLGVYPRVGLTDARKRRDEARRLIDQGTDPAIVRRQEKQDARETSLRNKAEAKSASRGDRFKVTIFTDGIFEIWKGRQVLRLSREEGELVRDLLTRLLREDPTHGG